MVFTVGIAGFTGRLPQAITQELLSCPDVHVRGYSRDPSKLPSSLLDSPNVAVVQGGPFDKPPLRSFAKGCNVVICCYSADGKVMLDGQKMLIDICEEEGVPRYIPSDFTYDYTKIEYGKLTLKEPAKRIKEYLDEKTNIRGVHILLGCFMEIVIYGIGIWKPQEKKLQYWGSGEESWELITYSNAAQYITAVALDAEITGVLRFYGDRKNTHEIAGTLESVYGFRPIVERLGSLEDLYQGAQQNRMMAVMYYIMTGQITFGENIDNSRYPDIKPETLRQFLEYPDASQTA